MSRRQTSEAGHDPSTVASWFRGYARVDLIRFMHEMGWSFSELAYRLGLNPSTVASWFRGYSPVRVPDEAGTWVRSVEDRLRLCPTPVAGRDFPRSPLALSSDSIMQAEDLRLQLMRTGWTVVQLARVLDVSANKLTRPWYYGAKAVPAAVAYWMWSVSAAVSLEPPVYVAMPCLRRRRTSMSDLPMAPEGTP